MVLVWAADLSICGNVACLVLNVHIRHGAYLDRISRHTRQQHVSGPQLEASSRAVVQVYLCLVSVCYLAGRSGASCLLKS